MWRPRLSSALAVLFAVLAALTTIWPQWIESVTGLDPDGGSGSLEWLIVAVLGVCAVTSALLARHGYAALRRVSTEQAR